MNSSWKQQTRAFHCLALCGLLLASTACPSEEDVDTPTDKEYDDIARGIGPLVSVQLESDGVLETSTQLAYGEEPLWLQLDSTGAMQGTVGGFAWNVGLECWAAGHQAQEGCNESTDEAQLRVFLDGGLNLPNYQADVDIDSTWSFAGLQGSTITATGDAVISAESNFDSLFFAVARSYQFDLDLTYNFQIPTDQPEAAVGSAEATVDALYSSVAANGSTSGGRFRVEARIELDGNGHATLTLDGVAEYQLNLETGIVVRI